MGQVLKRIATHLPLNKQVEIVAKALPRSMWFRAALRVSAIQGRVTARLGGNGPLTQALMLDHWLRQLTFEGHFPVPYRVHGLDVLQQSGAKLYTWTHVPMVEVPLRAIVEQSGAEAAVVADPGKIVEGERFLVFGVKQHPEAIRVGDGMLLRVCRRLQAGLPVCFLADPYLGGALSDVPLRLAARMHVPVVVQWAELAADQVFDITFRLAPYPLAGTEAEIQGNLAFLREARRRSLQSLGWTLPESAPDADAGALAGLVQRDV